MWDLGRVDRAQAEPRRSVCILLPSTAGGLEISAVWAALDAGRNQGAGTPYSLELVATSPGVPVDLLGSACVIPRQGLALAASADFVVLAPPAEVPLGVDRGLAQALTTVVARGGRVLGLGTSTFLLAEAGLLDGRSAASDGPHAAELVRRFPGVRVSRTPRWKEDRGVVTAVDLDAATELCRQVGRELVGGAPASPATGDMDALMRWMCEHLSEELTLDRLAAEANVSRRSLSRQFLAVSGATPYAWILGRRLERACELLRVSAVIRVETVAAQSGFGDGSVMRRHFQQKLGCSPTEYRRRHASAATVSVLPVDPDVHRRAISRLSATRSRPPSMGADRTPQVARP